MRFSTFSLDFGDKPCILVAAGSREADGKTACGKALGNRRAYVVTCSDN